MSSNLLSASDPVSWRRRIAVAGQDSELVTGSVFENIAYGRADASLVEVTDASTDLTRQRFRLADDYITARIALAELHHQLGRDTKLAREAAKSHP